MKPLDGALAEAIRRARLREGLTQGEPAAEVWPSQGQVSHWERGGSQRSDEQLAALKQALGRLVRRGNSEKAPARGRRVEKTTLVRSPRPAASPIPGASGEGAADAWADVRTPKALPQQELESRLWAAADSLRGPVDPADVKAYIFPLLFFKWISDTRDIEHQEAVCIYGLEVRDEEEVRGRDRDPRPQVPTHLCDPGVGRGCGQPGASAGSGHSTLAMVNRYVHFQAKNLLAAWRARTV
jgi:transcriptional regulator with XRE-family HTH domain